jgi:uridine phosphorylase
MVPRDFPAVPDFELTQHLVSELRAGGWQGRHGTIVTSDLFYPGLIDDELKLYQKAGAIAVEMECSTLFVISQLRNVRAAAVLVCDGNPLKWEEGVYDPRPERLAQSMQLALHAALTCLVR